MARPEANRTKVQSDKNVKVGVAFRNDRGAMLLMYDFPNADPDPDPVGAANGVAARREGV